MIERLVEQIEERFEDLSKQMTDPEVIGDRARYAEVGRAYSALEPAHALAIEYRKAADDAAGARQLLSEDGDDPELREILHASEERLGELVRRLQGTVCPSHLGVARTVADHLGIGHLVGELGEAALDLVYEGLDHGIESRPAEIRQPT